MSRNLTKVYPPLSKAANNLIDAALNEMLKVYEPASTIKDANYTPTTHELYQTVISFCDSEYSQLFSSYQFAQKLIALNFPFQWIVNKNGNSICWLLKKKA